MQVRQMSRRLTVYLRCLASEWVDLRQRYGSDDDEMRTLYIIDSAVNWRCIDASVKF